MTDWQPIETAPKSDGWDTERVLATDGNVVSGAYWERWNNSWICEAEITTEYDNAVYGKWEPTHWMPLPEPPK